jgi:hypothetical protein
LVVVHRRAVARLEVKHPRAKVVRAEELSVPKSCTFRSFSLPASSIFALRLTNSMFIPPRPLIAAFKLVQPLMVVNSALRSWTVGPHGASWRLVAPWMLDHLPGLPPLARQRGFWIHPPLNIFAVFG